MLPAGPSEAAPRLCCRVEVDGELPCRGLWGAAARRLTEATGLERTSGGRAAVRGKGVLVEAGLSSGPVVGRIEWARRTNGLDGKKKT